jgi:hypothetical protein
VVGWMKDGAAFPGGGGDLGLAGRDAAEVDRGEMNSEGLDLAEVGCAEMG